MTWQKWVYAGAAVFLTLFAVVFVTRGREGFAALMVAGVFGAIVLLATEPNE